MLKENNFYRTIYAFDIAGNLCDGILYIPKKMKITFHPMGYIYIIFYENKMNAEIHTGEMRLGDVRIVAEKQENRESCAFYYARVTSKEFEEQEMSGIYASPQMSNLQYLKKCHPEKIKHLPLKYRQGRVSHSSVFGPEGQWGVSFFDKGGIVFNYTITDVPAPKEDDLLVEFDKSLAENFKTWIQSKVELDTFENISTSLENLKEKKPS